MSKSENNICHRFSKAADIQNLRRLEARAIREGTRTERLLPPPPVLPPYGKLEKVTGCLESFSSEYYSEVFSVKNYRNNTLPTISEAQRGAGAVLATVAGSPATGAALLSSDEKTIAGREAEYVRGIINGKPFRGWVGLTRLKAGDYVEMAVDWQEEHYEVYAITLPDERIISICPRCDMGRTAHAWIRLRNMMILLMSFLSMFAVIFFINLGGPFSKRMEIAFYTDNFIVMWMMAFFIFFVFFGLMAISAYKAYANTTCLLSEEIFSVLGMKDVEKINLNKTTKKRERELKRKGLWYSPKDKTKPACPTQKSFGGFESWYYY